MWKKIRCFIFGHVYVRVGDVIWHPAEGDKPMLWERDLNCQHCHRKITEVVS